MDLLKDDDCNIVLAARLGNLLDEMERHPVM